MSPDHRPLLTFAMLALHGCIPAGAVAVSPLPANLPLSAPTSSAAESLMARTGLSNEIQQRSRSIPRLVLSDGLDLIDRLQADVGVGCTVERLSDSSGSVDPTALKITCEAGAFFAPGLYAFSGGSSAGWVRAANTMNSIATRFSAVDVVVRGLSDRVPIDPSLDIYRQPDNSQEFRPCPELQRELGLRVQGRDFDVSAARQDGRQGPRHREANTWLSWCRAGSVVREMSRVMTSTQLVPVRYTIIGMGDSWQRAHVNLCGNVEPCDAARRVEVFVRFETIDSTLPSCYESGVLPPGPVSALRCYERVLDDGQNVLQPTLRMTGRLPFAGGTTPPDSILRPLNSTGSGISPELHRVLLE